MIMKPMSQENQSSSHHLPNGVLTCNQSQNDQQMGRPHDSMAQNGTQRFPLLCCLSGLNLNPARIIIAEILGTFILMFSICGILGSMQLLGGRIGLMEYAITAGSAIVAVVFSLGPISGAHVNPSLTLAFAIFGHFPWSKVPFYVGAQILGSILATYCGELVYGVNPELMITQPIRGGTNAAFWAEFIATFILTFLTASLAKDAKSVGYLSGFVMGIAIMLAVLITGPISGGSMNPARSLGPAILSWKFDHIWIYFLGPILGAILGVLMVHVLCLHQQSPQSLDSSTTNSLP